MHKREKRRALLFGEVLIVDNVFGTNMRRRPVFDAVCKDGNNRNIVVMEVLLRDEKEDSFLWIFSQAFHTLLGEEFCDRVQVVIADGDVWQERVIGSLCSLETGFPNARFRTCGFHLITLKLIKVKKSEAKEKIFSKLCWSLYKTKTKEETSRICKQLKKSSEELTESDGDSSLLRLALDRVRIHWINVAGKTFIVLKTNN